MEAILKFNLPDERDDHVLAVKSSNMYGALWDMSQYLRSIEKYADKTPEIGEIREKFREILEDNSFDLHEVS